MSLEHSPQQQARRARPRFASINTAVAYGGVSRSALYKWAKLRPTLFRKHGAATLVDFDVYDAMLDALPVAELKQG
jgi:hypothetical protein